MAARSSKSGAVSLKTHNQVEGIPRLAG